MALSLLLVSLAPLTLLRLIVTGLGSLGSMGDDVCDFDVDVRFRFRDGARSTEGARA